MFGNGLYVEGFEISKGSSGYNPDFSFHLWYSSSSKKSNFSSKPLVKMLCECYIKNRSRATYKKDFGLSIRCHLGHVRIQIGSMMPV